MRIIENHSDEAVWMKMARKEGSMQTEMRNVTKENMKQQIKE